jgi:hypothetical protein
VVPSVAAVCVFKHNSQGELPISATGNPVGGGEYSGFPERHLGNLSAFRIAVVLWIASNVFVTLVAKLDTWEGNAAYKTFESLCRWDCGWYSAVLEHGYDKIPPQNGFANWPFHPLLPLAAYPLHSWLKLHAGSSIVLISKLALLLGIYAFILLVSDESSGPADRICAGTIVAFNPYLIYAHAGYAEPLYFALLSFAFFFLKNRRWVSAGAAGALVSATRMVGFLFAVPYVITWLRQRDWRSSWRDPSRILGLLLCPLGTAVFVLYLYRHTGDALAQVHANVAWGKSPGNPFHILMLSVQLHHWPRVWATMVIASLLVSAYLIKLRKLELGIYLALVILLSFSGGYYSTARYVWWQPPMLYAIYLVVRRRPLWWTIYLAFASCMASFMIIEWFNLHNFVE